MKNHRVATPLIDYASGRDCVLAASLACSKHARLPEDTAEQASGFASRNSCFTMSSEIFASSSGAFPDSEESSIEGRLRRYDATEIICGVDEAGRGPLAGPVFAAAVILDRARPISGLRDSKKLTEARRDALAIQIRNNALAWSIAQCSETEIDTLNILQATMLAMRRAIEGLPIQPTLALIDGNRCPSCAVRSEAVIKGDDKVPAISAASILAKTARDAALAALHLQYPDYAFDRHKGYPTALHLERLRAHGVSPVHRKSYAPVRALLVCAGPDEST